MPEGDRVLAQIATPNKISPNNSQINTIENISTLAAFRFSVANPLTTTFNRGFAAASSGASSKNLTCN